MLILPLPKTIKYGWEFQYPDYFESSFKTHFLFQILIHFMLYVFFYIFPCLAFQAHRIFTFFCISKIG